jgi:hypothetical protein
LSGLGIALHLRFERNQDPVDLDSAISHLCGAVQAACGDKSDFARFQVNLGNALHARFQRDGAPADLDAAIEAGQEAVLACPADHPDRAICLSYLGGALASRFKYGKATADRNAAFERYAEAASVDVAAASVRIDAYRRGARLVAGTDPTRAAGLLEAAVLLLPQVAPRFLERGDQQYEIARFAGLAADAAALALSDTAVSEAQRPVRALRLLEAAQGVLLSQAFSTRGDLSGLQDRHPDLAVRFIELRDQLDQPSSVDRADLAHLLGSGPANAARRTFQDRRRRVNEEFTQLLTLIRSLEGFRAFALPPSAEQLEAQAEEGPVVVLNVSAYRSDAILLTGSGIASLQLPGLDAATVNEQVIAFHAALDAIAATGSTRDGFNAQRTLLQVLAWLWDNAAGPVLSALGYREQPAAGEPWPRLWWVTGGPLSLLPIHASGHHASQPDSSYRTVMDRVVSSYTPTVGALTHARITNNTFAPSETNRSLIVAMPTTPGLPNEGKLKYVTAEAAMLNNRLPHPVLLLEPSVPNNTGGSQLPTKNAVLDHLAHCNYAHFACHSYSDPADPSQSRLLLHDHQHDPLTVAALASLTFDRAQLAYLSACSTAIVTNINLLDEAIHLTSALQLAGFRHVIGTLWEVGDTAAFKVADTFYAALASFDGTLSPDHAAYALHGAIRAQRDKQPATPYLWAAHIHVGV